MQEPRREAIARNIKTQVQIKNLLNWPTIAGLQLESLILQNRDKLFELLKIEHEDVVQEGPFFQTTNARRKGCQIDYLIQTRQRVLHVCEIKRSQMTIPLSVKNDVQEKISRLQIPRGFSVRSHLIYAGDLNEDLQYDDFFDTLVCVEDFF